MTRVQIISSTPDVARLLRDRLADDTIEVVAQGSAGTGGDSVRGQVDVLVIFDNAARPLRTASRDGAPMLVLSNDPALAEQLRATAPGAWGVVSPDVDAGALRAAVRAVAAGFTVTVPRPTVTPRPSALVEDAMPAESLTPREQDVLHLLAEGLSNRAIAASLGISDHTVKFHLAAIFGKLGARTRTEAVRRGLRRGLLHI
jgi:DNA-binding NarL/FixJ family response regulator